MKTTTTGHCTVVVVVVDSGGDGGCVIYCIVPHTSLCHTASAVVHAQRLRRAPRSPTYEIISVYASLQLRWHSTLRADEYDVGVR